MKKVFILTLMFLTTVLYSCRSPKPVSVPELGYTEIGIASWYGQEFHGRPTASQEIFDQHDLTAAHRTLPFGTMVLVTNLENGRQVTVRINDRGPFVRGRIIDLSYAAARLLGIVGPGTSRVKIEVVSFNPKEEKPTDGYILQVGSFVDPDNARALYLSLKKEFPDIFISVYRTDHQTFHRVRLRANSEAEARELAARLVKAGHPVLILSE
ncbi:MAG: septal ring lytic transglycosylase RlpA family protein [Acidobacteriota bacterium]|nr:septal ring lytic transglycosylase RlpA family protein [Acidobacteriota bacterium]